MVGACGSVGEASSRRGEQRSDFGAGGHLSSCVQKRRGCADWRRLLKAKSGGERRASGGRSVQSQGSQLSVRRPALHLGLAGSMLR
jgi:hypothetical protein